METQIEHEQILRKLQSQGFICTVQQPINYGIQLRFANGAILSIYRTGKLVVQGSHQEQVRAILGISVR